MGYPIPKLQNHKAVQVDSA